MSRTDLDPACLVKALRRMAGDGGMEWCCEPIRASVLLDVADPPERVDLVQVVRCRDCKHYSEHEWIIATDVEHVCHFWHGKPTKVEPDGFCAWGRRTDG